MLGKRYTDWLWNFPPYLSECINRVIWYSTNILNVKQNQNFIHIYSLEKQIWLYLGILCSVHKFQRQCKMLPPIYWLFNIKICVGAVWSNFGPLQKLPHLCLYKSGRLLDNIWMKYKHTVLGRNIDVYTKQWL